MNCLRKSGVHKILCKNLLVKNVKVKIIVHLITIKSRIVNKYLLTLLLPALARLDSRS